MIQETRAELDHSHRRNLAAIDWLMTPLQLYVEQGDLAHELAYKTGECNKLHCTLNHQHEENHMLQASLNPYQEKEAVATASGCPVAPPPGFAPQPAFSTRQCELVLAQVQTMNVPMPEITEGAVTAKP